MSAGKPSAKRRMKRRAAHMPTQASKRQMFHAVAVRDGWTCTLCGEPVDRELPREHWMAGTLDHIVPFPEGGRFMLANLQLAHRLCNQRRAGDNV